MNKNVEKNHSYFRDAIGYKIHLQNYYIRYVQVTFQLHQLGVFGCISCLMRLSGFSTNFTHTITYTRNQNIT